MVDVRGKVPLCEKPGVQVKSLWHFGSHIDSNLLWKHYSDKISAIIARGVGIFRALKDILPELTLCTIYL